jgi:hypothetical protein
MTKAVAVIPTKSNFAGLLNIVKILEANNSIHTTVVVADGETTYNLLERSLSRYDKIDLRCVPLGSGIHVMWNLGLELATKLNLHAIFINDDVSSNLDTASILCESLDKHSELRLVCPNYDNRQIGGAYQSVTTTCGGRYDGTGGLAGFYMALHKDLVPDFRFNEKMKWYYGDDDILMWVLSRGYKAAILSFTFCWGNESKTISVDPPKNFEEDIKKDKLIYKETWSL